MARPHDLVGAEQEHVMLLRVERAKDTPAYHEGVSKVAHEEFARPVHDIFVEPDAHKCAGTEAPREAVGRGQEGFVELNIGSAYNGPVLLLALQFAGEVHLAAIPVGVIMKVECVFIAFKVGASTYVLAVLADGFVLAIKVFPRRLEPEDRMSTLFANRRRNMWN